MARGWESKSVEAQQDATEDARAPGPARSPEEVERLREQTTLQLARTEALGQLQRACAPAHRAMLEQKIADLEREINLLNR